MLALLLAAPLLLLPAAVQLLLPGRDRYLPGGERLATASVTAPSLALQAAHALGRTDGAPGRWPMPAWGDNQRGGASVPTPSGGGGRARRPAGSARGRAKLRSVRRVGRRRRGAARRPTPRGWVHGGGWWWRRRHACPSSGRPSGPTYFYPSQPSLTHSQTRSLAATTGMLVVEVRQHRLGLPA